jgi:2-(1,2-epoxy-1,2-dihydrophenyl)acetyl-CoA isomerase
VSDEILMERADGVGWIRLNRPARRNALTYPMLEALLEACEEAAGDHNTRSVVLTGVGSAFCAGGDIEHLIEESAAVSHLTVDDKIARLRRLHRISMLLATMPKPTIAAINGPAMGAGLSLALACDLRIASSSAVLCSAFARLGVSGDFGGSWFASHVLGQARARELYFLSQTIGADQALQLGMVTTVAPDHEFDKAVVDLAAALAHGPTLAFALMKENFAMTTSAALAPFLDQEAETMVRGMESGDHGRAARAFRDGGPPRFEGC